jgi:hypothetical protein
VGKQAYPVLRELIQDGCVHVFLNMINGMRKTSNIDHGVVENGNGPHGHIVD